MKMLKEKKLVISLLILTIIAIISNLIIINKQYEKEQEQINIAIANIVGKLNEKYPEISDEEIISILNMNKDSLEIGYNILEKYGIHTDNMSVINGLESKQKEIIIYSTTIIIILFILIIFMIFIFDKKRNKKIQEIIRYIEEISRKNYDLKIEENSEDELSNLTNELYKVTVMLKEQADISNKDKKILQTSIEDISHQLKTPLTSISIMLDNIRENANMSEKTRQGFVKEISRQIDWINWLIVSLLKLAKLDSNTVIFNKREIYAKELINQVINNLSIPIDIKQQQIIVQDKDVKFIGDYNWQLEAITNIVKNCIEHTPENGKIYIDFEENNFYTKIIIKDEGNGIDSRDIKHIFERFYKGKNSSENSVGIGLALAKSIIEKDNGFINCSSVINEGSIFEVKYMK